MTFRSDVSMPERALDPPAMPSVHREQDRLAAATDRLSAALIEAVSDLGWLAVDEIVQHMKAED